MLAGDSCSNRKQQSVILIPPGHPLSRVIGTSYQDTLTDYLGRFSQIQLTQDANANAALLSAYPCTKNTAFRQSTPANAASDSMLRDAQTLITSARAQLSALDPASSGYASLSYAIVNLENCISSVPDTSSLIQAMSMLTQAMGSARQ